MTKEKINTFNGVTCGADALGELLGVTRETVARFAKVDGMPKGGRGVYPVAECVNWCIDRERNKGSNESPADKQARIDLNEQQTLKLKLQNQQSLLEMLPVELVRGALFKAVSSLASELEGLAARIAPELIDIDQPAEMQGRLRDELRQIRYTYATTLGTIAGDIVSGNDSKTTAKPKRRAVGRRRKSAAE